MNLQDISYQNSHKSHKRHIRKSKRVKETQQHGQIGGVLYQFKSQVSHIITFTKTNTLDIHHPHKDITVVTVEIGNHIVHGALVDGGSSINFPSKTLQLNGLPK